MIPQVKNFLFGGSLPSLLCSMVMLQEEFLKEFDSLRGKIILDLYNETVMRSSSCSACTVSNSALKM